MLRRLARRVLYFLGGIVVLGGILVALGLRPVFGGAGIPHLAFTKSADARAAEIEKHREAQRAQTPPAAAVQADPAAPAASASPGAATAPVSPAANSIHWTSFRGPHRDGHYASSRCVPTGAPP